MTSVRGSAALLLAGAVGVFTVRAAAKRRAAVGDGWKSVTVLAPPERITATGGYPGPLALLAEHLEIELRPAPGDRGTEVHARVRRGRAARHAVEASSGEKPDAALRIALRDAKQIVETGEVMRVDPRPHGARTATPAGALVDAAESSAKGKGLL